MSGPPRGGYHEFVEAVATWVLAGSVGILTLSVIGTVVTLLAVLRAVREVRVMDPTGVVQALRTLANERVGAVVSDGRGGTETVLLVRQEDYAGLEETAYLLGDSANAAHLTRSIEQLDRGEGKARDLIEG
jgi:antitoxin YefM